LSLASANIIVFKTCPSIFVKKFIIFSSQYNKNKFFFKFQKIVFLC
jgi:hypothetical protein